MTKKTFIAPLLLVLAIAAWLAWTLTGQAPAPPESQPAPPSSRVEPGVLRYPQDAPQLSMIAVRRLHASPVPYTDVLSARLAYDEDRTARIGAGLNGRIVRLRAAPGDVVKQGQMLAEIDSPDFGAATADLLKARTDEAQKRQAAQRAADLGPGDAIALRDWEVVQAELAQARAESVRAEQRLRSLNPWNLRVEGQRVKLASPINGVVAERGATLAQELNGDQATPLFVVTDPRHLWLMIDVPERLHSRIRAGGRVEIESDAYPDERFSATIVQPGLIVDVNTRRVTVRASLDNPDLKLLPEMFVRTHLLQDSGTGVRVPNTAIVINGIHAHVFVQVGPGTFARRKVMLLNQGSESSYVGEGLTGGEEVAVSGALLLEGELVARAGDAQ